ncbi:MAG TPA: hypothetical protein VGJ57_08190, partial [Nitrospirales bacterium]
MSFLSKEAFLEAPSPVPLAIVLTLPACSTFELYERLVAHDACPVLLETAGREIQGYSIIASAPSRIFRVTGARLECLESAGGCTIIQRDPFSALRDLISRMALPRPSGFPPFFGGAIGYFGYDFVHWFERLPRRIPEDLGLPEVELAFFELVAVIDH